MCLAELKLIQFFFYQMYFQCIFFDWEFQKCVHNQLIKWRQQHFLSCSGSLFSFGDEREIVSPGRPMATTNSTFVMRYVLSCLALFHQFYITPWTANLLAINFGLAIIYSRLPSFNLVFILSFSLSWYYCDIGWSR